MPAVPNVLNLFQMEISYYLSWRRGHAEGRGCNENTQETGELIGGVRDDLVCFTGCERSKYVEGSYSSDSKFNVDNLSRSLATFFTLQNIAEKSFSHFIISLNSVLGEGSANPAVFRLYRPIFGKCFLSFLKSALRGISTFNGRHSSELGIVRLLQIPYVNKPENLSLRDMSVST